MTINEEINQIYIEYLESFYKYQILVSEMHKKQRNSHKEARSPNKLE